MRTILYAFSILAVIILGFWAYNEGYKTRATEQAVTLLKSEIGKRHEEMAVLRAEWAYLNRPERLRELAEMNFEKLGLMPLSAEHYGLIEQISFPPPPTPEPIFQDLDGDVIDMTQAVTGVTTLRHEYGADAAPALIAPPTLAEDGEQLP
jgi:hypothetical protein